MNKTMDQQFFKTMDQQRNFKRFTKAEKRKRPVVGLKKQMVADKQKSNSLLRN